MTYKARTGHCPREAAPSISIPPDATEQPAANLLGARLGCAIAGQSGQTLHHAIGKIESAHQDSLLENHDIDLACRCFGLDCAVDFALELGLECLRSRLHTLDFAIDRGLQSALKPF